MTRFKYLNKTRSDAINSLSIFFYAKKKTHVCWSSYRLQYISECDMKLVESKVLHWILVYIDNRLHTSTIWIWWYVHLLRMWIYFKLLRVFRIYVLVIENIPRVKESGKKPVVLPCKPRTYTSQWYIYTANQWDIGIYTPLVSGILGYIHH